MAGIAFVGSSLTSFALTPTQRWREVVPLMASGSKIVDIHAHCIVAEAAVVTNHPLQAPVLLWSNVSDRIAEKRDAEGGDVEAFSIVLRA